MPPLSSLSLNQRGGQQQPPQGYQAAPSPSQFYQPPQLARQPLHSPIESNIQSWADSAGAPQQPRPVAPMGQGMWTPDMGIKFAPSPGGNGPVQGPPGGNAPVGGKWEPNSGIRFG